MKTTQIILAVLFITSSFVSTGEACLTPDTRAKTSDETLREIGSMTKAVSLKVFSINDDSTMISSNNTIISVKTGNIDSQLVRITWPTNNGDRSIEVTPHQPIMLSNGTMVQAGHLTPTSFLKREDGTQTPILSLNMVRYEGTVYQIGFDDFSGQHIFSANGLLVGDMYVEFSLIKHEDEEDAQADTSHPYFQEYVR